MKIVICDDDKMMVEDVKNRIIKFFENEAIEVKSFFSGEDFIECIQNEDGIDLVVMDIELNDGLNGIEFVKELNKKQRKCKVIYLTGYVEYVSSVYETEHEYFVLKTAIKEYFEQALKKAVAALRKNKKMIFIESRFCKALIDCDEIIYIERNKRTTRVVCSNACYETSEKLDSVHQKLDRDIFIRCHNSYIINLKMVKHYKDNEFVLCTGETVKVTRTHKKQTEEKFFGFVKNSVTIN